MKLLARRRTASEKRKYESMYLPIGGDPAKAVEIAQMFQNRVLENHKHAKRRAINLDEEVEEDISV